MSERWRLSRAGIVNVYQYGDETLTFGGGRLLLRGVNGSGKSTAMNMLLPFLLDADTRRIDAAGEQSGVLKSWMLNGRTEQQPIGYLWLEVSRGHEHLVFGCGIKANRSTDTVKTWWFVTPRRPGVDLNLVERRTPLSSDALRSELGDHAVFKEKDRARYRLELRRGTGYDSGAGGTGYDRSGGAGGTGYDSGAGGTRTGSTGGHGVVIISYPTPRGGVTGRGGSVSTSDGVTFHRFDRSGTFTIR